jgi:hypothetical protein
MTSATFRQLRQIELVMWCFHRYGGRKGWREKLARDLGIPIIRTYRWFNDDVSGKIQAQVEAFAYANGFQSIYDEALGGVYHHTIVLGDVLNRALARNKEEGREKELIGAALPLNSQELDQVIAGLNYRLLCQR